MKRIIVGLIIVASLVLSASALASVNSNMVAQIAGPNIAPGAKHIFLSQQYTAPSGYFTARICTSDWVVNNYSEIFFPEQWIDARGSYSNNGNIVRVGSSQGEGALC